MIHKYLNQIAKIAILILFLFAQIGSINEASAQTYPGGGGFNGLNITYSISGVSLGTPVDVGDFTTSRTYPVGAITGSTITLSGSAANDWGASVNLDVTIQDKNTGRKQSYTKSFSSKTAEPFNISFEVYQDTTDIDWWVRESACYGNGECRGLVVKGSGHKDPTLVADFLANPLSGDSPLRVELSDMSTGANVTSWYWEVLGTDWTSTQKNPVVVLSTKAADGWKVSVRLTVTAGTLTATKTKTDYIVIFPDTVKPTLSVSSAVLSGKKVIISGKARDNDRVQRVAYCLNTCAQGSYKSASGSSKWKISLSRSIFKKGRIVTVWIWAQDRSGNWSTAVKKKYRLK